MSLLKRLLTVLVAVLLIAVPASLAQGAPGGGPGKPPDTGNGGGGGGNPNKGPGNKLGDLYADLWVIARYDNGTPIVDAEGCLRPITVVNTGDPVTGTNVYPYDDPMFYIPLVHEMVATSAVTEDEDEPEPCDVQADSAHLVEEVDLGRLNLGRAPERVLRKQLGDVELFLTSGATIGLDASGRFTRSIDNVVVQTLDSPLANLAAFQSILNTGMIGSTAVPMVDLTDVELTGAQLAAGAPKEGFVITVDTVQYLNRILGIPQDTTYMDTIPTSPTADEETFLDFSGVTFYRDGGAMTSYSRAAMFPGNMCFYDLATDQWKAPSIMSHVFVGEPSEGLTGIAGYVQFAEDAHKVLVEVHRLGLTLDFVSNITEDTAPASCGPTS